MESCPSIRVDHFRGAEVNEVLEDAWRCFNCRRCRGRIEFYPPRERINYHKYENVTLGIWPEWAVVIQVYDFELVIWRTASGFGGGYDSSLGNAGTADWTDWLSGQFSRDRWVFPWLDEVLNDPCWSCVPLQSWHILSLGLIALILWGTGVLLALAWWLRWYVVFT